MTSANAESELRRSLVRHAKSLFERNYSCGASGNLSARCERGMLITPTNSSLGMLNADRLSLIDFEGTIIEGEKPSKEWPLHRAFYKSRPDCAAVVHLHSPSAVALSCLQGLNHDNVLPALTPYYVMRIGSLPLVPYAKPGSKQLAEAVARQSANAPALLLGNHGPIVSGVSVEAAVYAAEELEETARIWFLLRNQAFFTLAPSQVAELNRAR